MAITINGSGTITGLTTGGLPDGSIATDDIANNAVTAGKLATTLDLSGKTVTLADGSVTAGQLATTLDLTGKTVTLPSGTGGKILQVVQTIKTDTFSGTSTSTEADIPGMSVSIQPDAAGSSILVQATIQVVIGGNYAGQHIHLRRGSDLIFAGDAAGSRNQALMALSFDMINGAYGPTIRSFSYLDSPTYTLGDTLTYKLTHQDTLGVGNNIFINRSVDNTDDASYSRTASNIIVMEVAA